MEVEDNLTQIGYNLLDVEVPKSVGSSLWLPSLGYIRKPW